MKGPRVATLGLFRFADACIPRRDADNGPDFARSREGGPPPVPNRPIGLIVRAESRISLMERAVSRLVATFARTWAVPHRWVTTSAEGSRRLM